MKISFLGGARTVTGSCFLVETNKKKFLVDCGLFQGKAKEILLNSDEFPFNIKEIDFVLLTHAHIDHSGKIPKLYNSGYSNPIFCTKQTFELCQIMLPDSGHIQEMEVEWLNRKRKREGKHIVTPLYTVEDAQECLKYFNPVSYDEKIIIDEDISIRFIEAGHMLGSSMIEVYVNENGKQEKMLFTGDMGQDKQNIIRDREKVAHADYLIMESTYGGRVHDETIDKGKKFLDVVIDTLEKGGNVIIPSFAVGRTQEILYEIFKSKMLNKYDEEYDKKIEKLLKIPVYVDSPLAVSATEIFKRNIELYDEEAKKYINEGNMPLEFPGLKLTQSTDESKSLNESQEQCIIISASGMCEAGRIKHHLKHNLWKDNSSVIFVGYQAEGTLGRRIVDGAKTVKIFGEDIKVNARVEYIEGFSCHADQNDLLRFVGEFKEIPKNIFIVHGEYPEQIILAEKIKELYGISAYIPEFGDVYELDALPTRVNVVRPVSAEKFERLALLDRIETIKEEINDMVAYIKYDLKNESNDILIKQYNEKIIELENMILQIVKM